MIDENTTEETQGAAELSLIGADLRGWAWGLELRNADLTDAVLCGADLVGEDLSHAILRRADLRGADLRGANFCGADLTGADLSGANLTGANLSFANLDGVDFRDAHLVGVDLTRTAGCFDDLIGRLRRAADLRGAISPKAPVGWRVAHGRLQPDGAVPPALWGTGEQ